MEKHEPSKTEGDHKPQTGGVPESEANLSKSNPEQGLNNSTFGMRQTGTLSMHKSSIGRASMGLSSFVYDSEVVNSAFIFLNTKTVLAVVDESSLPYILIRVLPKRKIASLAELKENEVIDLFMFGQKICLLVETKLKLQTKQLINSGDTQYNKAKHVCITIVLLDPRFKNSLKFDPEQHNEDPSPLPSPHDPQDGTSRSNSSSPTSEYMNRSGRIELASRLRKEIKEYYN